MWNGWCVMSLSISCFWSKLKKKKYEIIILNPIYSKIQFETDACYLCSNIVGFFCDSVVLISSWPLADAGSSKVCSFSALETAIDIAEKFRHTMKVFECVKNNLNESAYCCWNWHVDPFVHNSRLPKINSDPKLKFLPWILKRQIQFNFTKPNANSQMNSVNFAGASRTISINRQLITISTALLRMPPLLKSKCAPQSHREIEFRFYCYVLFTCLRASGHWNSISIKFTVRSLRSAHHSNINNNENTIYVKCKP